MSAPTATVLSDLIGHCESAGLAVRASAEISPADTVAPLAGFISSTFSPLVAEVAQRCLKGHYGEAPVPDGERIAFMILSPLGDLASARDVARGVAAGARVGPLLFFQSVPHAVAGHVAARWGLAGPVVCLSAGAEGIEAAALLLADGDAQEALVVLARQAVGDEGDRAAAVLVSSGGAP